MISEDAFYLLEQTAIGRHTHYKVNLLLKQVSLMQYSYTQKLMLCVNARIGQQLGRLKLNAMTQEEILDLQSRVKYANTLLNR